MGAALTAYQRIDSDSHWAPDAFLGMMTGLAMGEILCEAHDRSARARSRSGKGNRILLGAMPGGIILGFLF